MELNEVEVVVPTLDRPHQLRSCLASISAAGGNPSIIVVDQDRAGSAALVCLEFSNVRWLSHPGGGKSAALNAGIAATTSEFIAFTDDDCTVPRDWLHGGLAALRRHVAIGIAFGGAMPCDHDSHAEFVPWYIPSRRELRRGQGAIAKIGALGGNMFCRRSLFEDIGGFDELLGPGAPLHSGEDQDLNNRALRAGYRVLAEPSLLVTHWGSRRYSDGDVARLLRGYSVGIGALAMKDMRRGSFAGAYPVIRELAAEFRSAILSLWHPGRERYVFRAPWLFAGLWKGFRLQIDSTTETFIPAADRPR